MNAMNEFTKFEFLKINQILTNEDGAGGQNRRNVTKKHIRRVKIKNVWKSCALSTAQGKDYN